VIKLNCWTAILQKYYVAAAVGNCYIMTCHRATRFSSGWEHKLKNQDIKTVNTYTLNNILTFKYSLTHDELQLPTSSVNDD